MALAVSAPPMVVLVVSAAREVVDIVRVTLEDSTLIVFDVPDAESALAYVEDLRPGLVILDAGCADAVACDLGRRLRASAGGAATPIIALVAGSGGRSAACLAGAASACLPKPVSPVRLISLVERLLPEALSWRSQ